MLATTCRERGSAIGYTGPVDSLIDTLEVFATHKTGIDIIVGERDGAQFLKVKVQNSPVNGVQERATATQRVL